MAYSLLHLPPIEYRLEVALNSPVGVFAGVTQKSKLALGVEKIGRTGMHFVVTFCLVGPVEIHPSIMLIVLLGRNCRDVRMFYM
jgi:hypothetical protein